MRGLFSTRNLIAAACAVGLIVAAGCGGPSNGKVGGSVTYKGQPVTQGEVSFYSKDKGIGATAKIDASGKYAFEQPLAEGTYAVAIVPAPPDAAAPGTVPKPATNIPKKFQDPAGSGLSCVVKSGDNDYPIVLKD